METSNQIQRVYECCGSGEIDHKLLSALFPNAKPSDEEVPLWDYKLSFPNSSDKSSDKYKYDMDGLVKDVVAFYNSYGGVIVSGIFDSPRRFVGDNSNFDSDDLKRRVKNATRVEISVRFSYVDFEASGSNYRLGIILVPQRGMEAAAQFRRNAKQRQIVDGEKSRTKSAFAKGIYLRTSSECRPAEDWEDWAFLVGDERFATYRSTNKPTLGSINNVENNLGPRDWSMYQFIGRDAELLELWQWLSDPFTPVKLVSGYGGLGKTTLVRQFAEDIISAAPAQLEKVIWLTAKRQKFSADKNKVIVYENENKAEFHDVPKFHDIISFCNSILEELAFDISEFSDYLESEEFIPILENALRTISCIVIIDDVDTLVEEQHELFQFINLVFGRAVVGSEFPSRAIITARQTLGAAGTQLMPLHGLPNKDFHSYIESLRKNGWPELREFTRKISDNIHKVCDGSPLFAMSILHQMKATGQQPDMILREWKASSGITARKFAFERELSRLPESALRILYTAIVLEKSSQIELQAVLSLPDETIEDDLTRLREYHLVGYRSDIDGGMGISIPSSMMPLRDVIAAKIKDPKAIERACARIRGDYKTRPSHWVAEIVNRVNAFWAVGEMVRAFETANQANITSGRKNPDILCLLGCAQLRANPSIEGSADADATFRHAYDAGCRKSVLFSNWIEARSNRGDWDGVIDLTRRADDEQFSAKNIVTRATAYREKGLIQEQAGNFASARDIYLEGAREVRKSFESGQAKGRVEQLKELKQELFDRCFVSSKEVFRSPDQGIELWELAIEAARSHAPRIFMIEDGAEALGSWSRQILFSRDQYHGNTLRKLEISFSDLESVIKTSERLLSNKEGVIEKLWNIHEVIGTRLETYRQEIGR